MSNCNKGSITEIDKIHIYKNWSIFGLFSVSCLTTILGKTPQHFEKNDKKKGFRLSSTF